jgi:hypothetical protein
MRSSDSQAVLKLPTCSPLSAPNTNAFGPTSRVDSGQPRGGRSDRTGCAGSPCPWSCGRGCRSCECPNRLACSGWRTSSSLRGRDGLAGRRRARMARDTGTPAQRHGRPQRGLEKASPRAASSTMPMNLAGTPAICLPSGFSPEGLPNSIQFAGRGLSEAVLCRVAGAYERATKWHERHPNV